MNPMFVLAEIHAQGSLHRLAYSARPDAPILPTRPRRRPLRLRPGTGADTCAPPADRRRQRRPAVSPG